MKSLVLTVATAVILLSTLVVPTIVRADGVGSTSCGGHGMCKP